MSKYILFCAQEANFQTRSMIIPYNKYLESEDLINAFDLLRKHSEQKTLDIDGKNYIIDNLLYSRIVWSDDYSGYHEKTPYSEIVSSLTQFAFGVDDESFTNDLMSWYSQTRINLCRGFDHVKNYCGLRAMTKYKDKEVEIVEGFLVLEKNLSD